jgi:hypothetical protein
MLVLLLEGFMKYAVRMGSGDICISDFIKIGSGIQHLLRKDTRKRTQDSGLVSLKLVTETRNHAEYIRSYLQTSSSLDPPHASSSYLSNVDCFPL